MTEEDEAFDELAKRQGMWGGGFMAKKAMAADKLQDGKCKYCVDGCIACDARAQPTQEPSACCHACFKASGVMVMTRIILCPSCGNKRCPKASNHRLECTGSNESGQAGSVYTTPPAAQPAQEPWNEDEWRRNNWRCSHGWLRGEQCEICNAPQREWVGLTDEEREGVAQDYSLTGLGYQSPFKAIEDMLKEKNT